MKLFPVFPLALALLFTACAAPEPPGDRHQRNLHEQARANFIMERQLARERSGRGAPQPIVAVENRAVVRSAAVVPQRSLRIAKAPRARPPRRVIVDDTLYEATVDGRTEQRLWEQRQAEKYRVFEIREARRLGKKPAQLTREERAWIRSMF